MSATERMSLECKKFYSRLAEVICKKRKTNYNITITWIGRKIAFSLINQLKCAYVEAAQFFRMSTWMSLSGDVSGDTYAIEFQSII